MEENAKNVPLSREIGQRIIKLRGANGNETQESLAASVGVSREIIQHWERGTRHIKAEHIIALAKHFNVSADWILGLTNEKTLNADIRQVCNYTGLPEVAVERLHLMDLNRDSANDVVIALVESILCRTMFRFRDYVWRAVLAKVQSYRANREPYRDPSTLGLPREEYWGTKEFKIEQEKKKEERALHNKMLIEEATKPKGTAARHIEIPAYDYARFYRDQAFKAIENSVNEAIRNYEKKVWEAVEEEETDVVNSNQSEE